MSKRGRSLGSSLVLLVWIAPLAAAAQTGDLRITSTPPGATVLVDGRNAGVTPTTVYDVPAGRRTVLVQLDGYHPKTRTVEVVERRKINLDFTLLKAPDPGTLFVRSRPSKARVAVDGKELGTTPLRTPPLSAGAHTLTVLHDRYQPYERQVSVYSGRSRDVEVRLLPRIGGMVVYSSVEGATVNIDEEPRGTIKGGRLRLENLVVGPYDVSGSDATAGEARSVETTVSESEITEVTLVFTPPGATLHVEAVPFDAWVRVTIGDSEEELEPPFDQEVDAGLVLVRAQHGDPAFGDRQWTKEKLRECAPGEVCSVRFDFTGEAPRREPGAILLRRALDGQHLSIPAVHGDHIFVAAWGEQPERKLSGPTFLIDVRREGSLRWSKRAGSGAARVAVLADGSPAIAFERGGVALYSDRGKRRWRVGHLPVRHLAAREDGGLVFSERAAGGDSVARVLANGAITWSAPVYGRVAGLAPAEKGRTVVTLTNGEVVVLNSKGARMARYKPTMPHRGGDCRSAAAVAGPDRYFAAPCAGELMLVSSRQLVWRVDFLGGSSGLALAPGGFIIAGAPNHLVAMTPAGKHHWSIKAEGDFGPPVVGADGTVYSVRGTALTAATRGGQIAWETELPAAGVEGLTLAPSGVLYLGCEGGDLIAVQTSSYGQADSPWPTAR